MAKYKLNKDFKFYQYFNAPFNKMFFGIGNALLRILPKKVKTDKDLQVQKLKINTFDNDKITIYVFTPYNPTNACMLYLHGGGFCYESIPGQYDFCREYAKRLNCTCVYVIYRLAPKHPYPIPMQDCLSAYKWIIDNANTLKIDPNKIIVAGDSAGGLLTVDTCRLVKQNNLPKPCFAVLIYPVLDRTMQTQSNTQYTDTPVWNANKSLKMWHYLLHGQKYISPAELKDLDFMPPSYIETAEFDCLRDEGIEFANRLNKQNIPTTLYNTKGTMHGYDIVSKSSITKQAFDKRISTIKEYLK